MTISLLLSWWIINKPGKSYIYVVSSVFVLLFSGFDTFHLQGKMRIVYRTFATLSLPCYLTLNNNMFDLTRKGMFQRGVNHACHCFDTYQLSAFLKATRVRNQPQICLYFPDFQSSKLIRPISVTKCIPVIFQPLSLIHCVPLFKDRSSFYEICRI